MSTTTPTAPFIERIRGAVGGRVIGPDDADYDAADGPCSAASTPGRR